MDGVGVGVCICACVCLDLDLGFCKDCARLYKSSSFSPKKAHSAAPCMQTRDSPDPAGSRQQGQEEPAW